MEPQTAVDYGDLIRSLTPRKISCVLCIVQAIILLLLAPYCASQVARIPAGDPYSHVKTFLFYMGAASFVIGALFMIVYIALMWRNSRIDFFERGIVYHKALGVARIPTESIRRVRKVSSIYGTYYYLYHTNGKVLFTTTYFGHEIESCLNAYPRD